VVDNDSLIAYLIVCVLLLFLFCWTNIFRDFALDDTCLHGVTVVPSFFDRVIIIRREISIFISFRGSRGRGGGRSFRKYLPYVVALVVRDLSVSILACMSIRLHLNEIIRPYLNWTTVGNSSIDKYLSRAIRPFSMKMHAHAISILIRCVYA
jgi:hypothetical protein